MAYSGFTATEDNGVLRVTFDQIVTSGLAEDEAIILDQAASRFRTTAANSEMVFRRCQLTVDSDIGAGNGTAGFLTTGSYTDTSRRMELYRCMLLIKPLPSRRNALVSHVTDTYIRENSAVAQLFLYTRAAAQLTRMHVHGINVWEVNNAPPEPLSEPTIEECNYGYLRWSGGRIDFQGLSVINPVIADFWINGGQAWHWNNVLFDSTRGRLQGVASTYQDGYTVGWRFVDRDSAMPVDGVKVILRDDFDGANLGAMQERGRYVSDTAGLLTGTYDGQNRVTGADQDRPVLFLMYDFTNQAGNDHSAGGGRTYRLDRVTNQVEIRSWLHEPIAGHLLGDNFTISEPIGTINEDYSLRNSSFFTLVPELGLISTDAATVSGWTDFSFVGRLFTRSRYEYWANDGYPIFYLEEGFIKMGSVGLTAQLFDAFGPGYNYFPSGDGSLTITAPIFDGSIETTGSVLLFEIVNGRTIKDSPDVRILTHPSNIVLDGSAYVVDEEDLYDFSEWSFVNGASITVADNTGAVTLILGANTPTVNEGTGNTVTIDDSVAVTIETNAVGGSFALENVTKFANYVGEYTDHATAQAANASPAAGDYYRIDAGTYARWDGSQWITGIADPHESFIGAVQIGGAGAPASAVYQLVGGDDYRVVVDGFGFYRTIGAFTAAAGEKVNITAAPNSVPDMADITSGVMTALGQTQISPPDSTGLIQIFVPDLSHLSRGEQNAYIETAQLAEGAISGALGANVPDLVELYAEGIRIKNDTVQILPLPTYPTGTKVKVGMNLTTINYSIEPVPVDANGNYVAFDEEAKNIVIGASILGEVECSGVGSGGSGDDASTIYNYFTAGARADVFKADVSGLSLDLTPVINAIDALNDLSLTDVEGSAVLAKEATLTNLATAIASIPTTDSVADLTPVLNAIGNLNDVTPAEVRAAFNAADFQDKNTEAEVHAWLDTYSNKDNWKADAVNVDESSIAGAVRTELSPELARIDVATSTRSSHSSPDLSNLDAPVSSRSTFDPATQQVTTDTASREASKADVSNLSADVNVVQVAGTPVSGVDDFKADAVAVDESAIADAVRAELTEELDEISDIKAITSLTNRNNPS